MTDIELKVRTANDLSIPVLIGCIEKASADVKKDPDNLLYRNILGEWCMMFIAKELIRAKGLAQTLEDLNRSGMVNAFNQSIN